jgi:hypothetical protein
MNKLIILTPSIIRGDFHIKSIGKFYEYFFEYLKDKYQIHHIVNIDEPENLKKYFNKYETIEIYNKIIPNEVNKTYIIEPNPGFLQAWKKIVLKIEELGLVNDEYLYYWLEDDWEPKENYDITKFFDTLKFPNTAYTITDKAPLGSFRGGPFMTGSYFSNIFNIRKYMNDTCDPERQMQRWIRGTYQKNGNSLIHRFSITNTNVLNEQIHIIIVCDKKNVDLADLNKHHYISNRFDKSIKFKFHAIMYENNNFEYSEIDHLNNCNFKKIEKNELEKIFSNNYIKYFIIKPSIMFDIGRKFNSEYGLQKWMTSEDDTNYANIRFYDTMLGNWKVMNENVLRLKPRYTMNKGFFSAFAYIHQCLPYLENKYFNKGINLNIQYYSHNYGSYPNFQVIGNTIQLNYIPSINKTNQQFEELNCLVGLCKKICGNQSVNEDLSLYYSYKNDFKLAKEHFYKYFKFNQLIVDDTNLFTKKFANKKVLGLHYRGTDKNKVKWVTHINIEEFIKIIEYHLTKNTYDVIFISTDDNIFIEHMNEKYSSKYEILHYDDLKNDENNNSIHLNRLSLMENKIKEINKKAHANDINRMVLMESNLKKETKINEFLLQNVIINSLILSKCDCVLKTHSQVSAYSKIFNPDLKIYRVNSCYACCWPDSHIETYDYNSIENEEVKNLLKSKLLNEFPENKKYLYNDMSFCNKDNF